VIVRTLTKKLARSLGYEIVKASTLPTLAIEEHLRLLFARLGIDCVLDVGANTGQYGELIRDYGYRGRIVSFEPEPESFRALEARIASDRLWTARQMALGAVDGQATLNVARSRNLSSFRASTAQSLEYFAGGASEVDRTERVEVRRLDAIFADCVAGLESPRVFLKIDTQGWDLEVLAGASGCLDAVAGLQIELAVDPLYEGAPTYLEALAFVRELGFAVTGFFPVVADEQSRVVEFDGVFTRR
jgi:FkbM family methyltransferase